MAERLYNTGRKRGNAGAVSGNRLPVKRGDGATGTGGGNAGGGRALFVAPEVAGVMHSSV